MRKIITVTVIAIIISLAAYKQCDVRQGEQVISAAEPVQNAIHMDPGSYLQSEARKEWRDLRQEEISKSAAQLDHLDGYYQEILGEVLFGREDNVVCSPLNLYLELSLLANITAGNTQQQILDVLRADNADELRQKTDTLWNLNNSITPLLHSRFVSSLWLSDTISIRKEELLTLAEGQHASVFRGVMGTEKLNNMLHAWIDKSTNSVLHDAGQNIQFKKDTELAVISTMLYKASWVNKFAVDDTRKERFYGTQSATDADMMHLSGKMCIYRHRDFTGVKLPLLDSGAMYIYLPNEEKSTEALQNTFGDIVHSAMNGDGDIWETKQIELSVPRFRIESDQDLRQWLTLLGITDIMDTSAADFSRITDTSGVCLTEAMHTAMIDVDEEGVSGAALTYIAAAGAAPEEDEIITICFDRPFIFVVGGDDGSMLLAGAVNNL